MRRNAIEDAGVAQEALISIRFSPHVTAIERACTDADTHPKPLLHFRNEIYTAGERLHEAALVVDRLKQVLNSQTRPISSSD